MFSGFFKKIGWWNIIIDVLLLLISVYVFELLWQGNKEVKYIYLLMGVFVMAVLHLFFLLILLMVSLYKRKYFNGLMLLIYSGLMSLFIYVLYIQLSFTIFLA